MTAKLPKHGRIKPKYSPEPTAREKAYHQWQMDNYPCACGCGKPSTVAHHVMARHPDKRWARRDHEMTVPMDGFCHMALHQAGSEEKFQPGIDYGWMAAMLRKRGYREGIL